MAPGCGVGWGVQHDQEEQEASEPGKASFSTAHLEAPLTDRIQRTSDVDSVPSPRHVCGKTTRPQRNYPGGKRDLRQGSCSRSRGLSHLQAYLTNSERCRRCWLDQERFKTSPKTETSAGVSEPAERTELAAESPSCRTELRNSPGIQKQGAGQKERTVRGGGARPGVPTFLLKLMQMEATRRAQRETNQRNSGRRASRTEKKACPQLQRMHEVPGRWTDGRLRLLACDEVSARRGHGGPRGLAETHRKGSRWPAGNTRWGVTSSTFRGETAFTLKLCVQLNSDTRAKREKQCISFTHAKTRNVGHPETYNETPNDAHQRGENNSEGKKQVHETTAPPAVVRTVTPSSHVGLPSPAPQDVSVFEGL